FIMKAVSWALRGFHLADFFETMMQIGVPAVTLVTFTTLMPAMFNASLAIGQALLVGITSTLDTPVKDTNAASVIVDMIVNYGKSLSLGCSLSVWNLFGILDCIKGMVVGLVALIIISILGVVLCAAIMVVDVWGFWVFGVALGSGELLMPF